MRLPNVRPTVSTIKSRSTSSTRRPTNPAIPPCPVAAAVGAGGPVSIASGPIASPLANSTAQVIFRLLKGPQVVCSLPAAQVTTDATGHFAMAVDCAGSLPWVGNDLSVALTVNGVNLPPAPINAMPFAAAANHVLDAGAATKTDDATTPMLYILNGLAPPYLDLGQGQYSVNAVYVGAAQVGLQGDLGATTKYAHANEVCRGAYPTLVGVHVCTTEEIVRSAQLNMLAPNPPFSSVGWLATGSQDCAGFSSSDQSDLGVAWEWPGGHPASVSQPCDTYSDVLCCQ